MIVGIAGKIGSGKDTAADFLIKKKGFKKYAFADNLKKMSMSIFSLSYDDCYSENGKSRKLPNKIRLNKSHAEKIFQWAELRHNWEITQKMRKTMTRILEKKEVFETPRQILQYIGTEVCRKVFHPDYHAIVTKDQMDQEKVKNIVICDVRFPNERKFIKKWGGQTCLITGRESSTIDKAGSHSSETSLGKPKDYSEVIHNTGTLEELEESIFDFVNKYSSHG